MTDEEQPEDATRASSKWLEALRRGDSKAADKFWSQYFSQMVQHAYAMSGNLNDAEDVAISAMRCCFHHLQNGKYPDLDEGSVGRMLYAIVSNKVNQLFRSQMRNPTHHISDEVLERLEDKRTIDLEVMNIINEFVQALPDENRKIVQLFMGGWSCKEIASEMLMSEAAVQGRLRRIRDRLRMELDDPLEE